MPTAWYPGQYYWEDQPDAVLAVTWPVQNTWYTILDTSIDPTAVGVRLLLHAFSMTLGIETIEVRWTIDGNVRTGSMAAVPIDTTYYVFKDPATGNLTISNIIYWIAAAYAPILCKSLKVEIRRTTAAGPFDEFLSSRIAYALWKP